MTSERCDHLWFPVTMLTAEGWDNEAQGYLFEVCKHDCGAIRERITGDGVVRVPESRNEVLLTALREIRDGSHPESREWWVADAALNQLDQEQGVELCNERAEGYRPGVPASRLATI